MAQKKNDAQPESPKYYEGLNNNILGNTKGFLGMNESVSSKKSKKSVKKKKKKKGGVSGS